MPVTGKGNFPFNSASVGRGRGRGRGKNVGSFFALYNSQTGQNTAPWNDWVFEAAAGVSSGVNSPTLFASGQSPASLARLVGFAGAAVITATSAALFPAPIAQPTPVPDSVSQLSRNLTTLQPVLSKYPHAEVVVAQDILRPIEFVAEQRRLDNLAPVLAKYPAHQDKFFPKTIFAPGQVPSNPQPQLSRQAYVNATAQDQVTPVHIATRPQFPETQQPQLTKYFFPEVIAQPEFLPKLIWVAREENRYQTQPVIKGQSDGARMPAGDIGSIPNQVPRIIQPLINKYFHAPVVVADTLLIKPVFARAHDSREQLQPQLGKYPHAGVVFDATPFIRRIYVQEQPRQNTEQPKIVRRFHAPAANIYTISPSGGLAFSGAPSFDQTNVIPVSGGIDFSGTASGYSKVNTIIASGGIEFTQTVTQNHTNVIQTSGSVIFSGTVSMVFVPAGGTLNNIISRLNVKISKAMGF